MIVDLIATDPFVRRLNLDTIKGEKDAFRYRIGDWRLAMSLSLLKFVGQASLVDDAMLPS